MRIPSSHSLIDGQHYKPPLPTITVCYVHKAIDKTDTDIQYIHSTVLIHLTFPLAKTGLNWIIELQIQGHVAHGLKI